MAKVRGVRGAPAQLVIHEDEPSDDEETLDESGDPMKESGGTHDDSSESEIEDSVAEDIARLEQTFRGIQNRYRLISQIGEGKCRIHRRCQLLTVLQVHSQQSTRQKICTTTVTTMTGTLRSATTTSGLPRTQSKYHPQRVDENPATSQLKRYMLPVAPSVSSTSSSSYTTYAIRKQSVP